MAKINIGSVTLSDHDADWTKAILGVEEKSPRALVRDLLSDYVKLKKAEYDELIKYTAAKYGLTWDDAFHRLVTGAELGDAVPNFEIKPELEQQLMDTLEG